MSDTLTGIFSIVLKEQYGSAAIYHILWTVQCIINPQCMLTASKLKVMLQEESTAAARAMEMH